MRVLLDCDGVLANFNALFLSVLNRLTGRAHGEHEITEYEYDKTVASKDEVAAVWRHIDETPGLVASISVLPDGEELLRGMRRRDFEVVCLHSPHLGPTWACERYRWLLEKLDFHRDEIVFSARKDLVCGDVIVDDHPEYINRWMLAHPHGHGVLVDRLWNQRAELVINAVRMKGTREILRYLERL